MADVLLVSMRALRIYFAHVLKFLDLKLKRHLCSISSEVYISFNARTNKSKRRNLKIFSPPDKIIQRSERKMKVVHQKRRPKHGNYFEINRFSTVLI